MTLDEAIRHAEEVAQRQDIKEDEEELFSEMLGDMYGEFKTNCTNCAEEHRQLAEWLKELKELREENKVLMQECDRLIKEKGELLSKVSGGDVLRICQLEEQFEKAKRLLKAAVEFRKSGYCTKNCSECVASPCDYIDWFKNMYDNEIEKLIGED